ncbi:MAG: hypothetical protein CM1200mP41_12830 [Gammaproteobacteria bacterium]|nr:MAG: hypothetical protein CM1200mP41_12830 [Gammaproteobacteria bacterium]
MLVERWWRWRWRRSAIRMPLFRSRISSGHRWDGWVRPLRRIAAFPKALTSVFLQVFDRDRVALRVWERGVGETQACGSGACAAMAVAHRQGLVGDRVAVELPGGTAIVSWMGRGAICLEGPAITVFQGRIDLESG